jgi:hypothetical protein
MVSRVSCTAATSIECCQPRAEEAHRWGRSPGDGGEPGDTVKSGKPARATPAETNRRDTTVPGTTHGISRAGYRARREPHQPSGLPAPSHPCCPRPGLTHPAFSWGHIERACAETPPSPGPRLPESAVPKPGRHVAFETDWISVEKPGGVLEVYWKLQGAS